MNKSVHNFSRTQLSLFQWNPQREAAKQVYRNKLKLARERERHLTTASPEQISNTVEPEM